MRRFVFDANMSGRPQLASGLAKNLTNNALISTAIAR